MHLSADIAAVVTGGASGLGRATVEKLRAEGVKVAIFDRDEERGQATAKELGATFCKVDVTSDDSVDAGFAAARKANGQERILVCCAGIGSATKTASRSKETGEIKHFPLNIFDLTIQVNLIGTYRCVAKSAAGMLTLEPLEGGERGAMVMTASVAAEDGQMGQAAYSASKGGVAGMTLPAARELARFGIRVVTLAPGIFRTPMLSDLPAADQDALGRAIPFPGRLGDPAEYAALVAHVLENRYLNGETIRIDGALRLAPRWP